MKILRERPDQRRHHRVTAPLFVTYGNETLRADDWSIGGLRLSGITGELPSVGDTIRMTLSLPFQGFDINFENQFQVVRLDKDTGMFAGQFLELSERQRDLMEHFIEDLIRGCMSEAHDTIQRIDVPVTPISTKPDVDPGVSIPLRRWSRKTIMMTGFYVLAGIGVFSYLALLIFTNFIRLEVDSAILTRPIIINKALADGTVAKHHFVAGQSIKTGDIITELSIPEIETDMDEARIQVMRYENAVARYKKSLGVAKKRSTVSTIEKIRSELAKQETELTAAKMRFENLKKALSRLQIKSPFDGRVIEIRKPVGSSVIYKEPLLVLERTGKPTIDAFLTQEEILKVALNDTASIYIPSLKQKTEAKIIAINRTTSNLDILSSRYLWQEPNAKSARVELEIISSDEAQKWPAGLPVTVLFKRNRDKTPILDIAP